MSLQKENRCTLKKIGEVKETEIYRIHKEPNGNYRIFDNVLNGEYVNTPETTYYKSLPLSDINNTSLKEYIESFIKALQKEAIKSVNMWNEEKIAISKAYTKR